MAAATDIRICGCVPKRSRPPTEPPPSRTFASRGGLKRNTRSFSRTWIERSIRDRALRTTTIRAVSGFYGALDIHRAGRRRHAGTVDSGQSVRDSGALAVAREGYELTAPHARTSARPTSPTAPTDCIRSNGRSAKPQGTLALDALANGVAPGGYPSDASKLRAYQQRLLRRGAPIFWWTDVRFGDAWFAAAHLMGVFRSDERHGCNDEFLSRATVYGRPRAAVEQQLGQSPDWPSDPMTRGATAQWLVDQLGW